MSSEIHLDTPCLLLDLDVLEGNLMRMQQAADHGRKHLRPHVKTHKCSALARRQCEMGAIGVCAAKVSEAERLVKAGIEGILITGPVVTPLKIARLLAIRETSSSIAVVVDHPDGVDLLDEASCARHVVMDVLVDIDVGLHRTGVLANMAWPLIERILARPNLRLRGVQAYAGHVQHIRIYEDRAQASRQCLQEATPIFQELRKRVPTCDIFTVGGTGTFDIDMEVAEVTELQVGSYVCMDTEYCGIGSADHASQFQAFGNALKVLATVVSVNHDGFVTIDAGLKSLYRDGGIPQVIGWREAGMQYDWCGDEYGRVRYSGAANQPALGAAIELIPSHCDPTINLFDRVHLLRGHEVVGVWPIDLRGCSQ